MKKLLQAAKALIAKNTRLQKIEAFDNPDEWIVVAREEFNQLRTSIKLEESSIEELEAQNAMMREALESSRAALWDAHYGKRISTQYVRVIDKKIAQALTSSPSDYRARVLEEAAKVADAEENKCEGMRGEIQSITSSEIEQQWRAGACASQRIATAIRSLIPKKTNVSNYRARVEKEALEKAAKEATQVADEYLEESQKLNEGPGGYVFGKNVAANTVAHRIFALISKEDSSA